MRWRLTASAVCTRPVVATPTSIPRSTSASRAWRSRRARHQFRTRHRLVSTSFAADKLDDAANALLVQPDGKLLAAGSRRISPNVYGLCLARYLGNGSPDTTFDAAFCCQRQGGDRARNPSRQCDPLAGAAT